jgi:hypothetical protein
MREMTKAEQLFCKEFNLALKTDIGWDGKKILLCAYPIIAHSKFKIAIMIFAKGEDISKDLRLYMAKKYLVFPFSEEAIMNDVNKCIADIKTALFLFIGEVEEYGLYCIDNAETMEETLRGAWEGEKKKGAFNVRA